MRRRTLRNAVALPLLIAASSLTIACSSTSVGAIRSNPTPEVMTTGQTPDDIDNALTTMADNNFRMLLEDLGRALLTNRPSRLHPGPVPY